MPFLNQKSILQIRLFLAFSYFLYNLSGTVSDCSGSHDPLVGGTLFISSIILCRSLYAYKKYNVDLGTFGKGDTPSVAITVPTSDLVVPAEVNSSATITSRVIDAPTPPDIILLPDALPLPPIKPTTELIEGAIPDVITPPIKPTTGLIEVIFPNFEFSEDLVSPAHPKLYVLQRLGRTYFKVLRKQFDTWGATHAQGYVSDGEMAFIILNQLIQRVDESGSKVKIKIGAFLESFNLKGQELENFREMVENCDVFIL